MTNVSVGTAGWGIPRDLADHFPAEGSGLERYASCFPVAEINSSFHRPHRASTWERWRDSVPDDFRFSVKLAKSVTHQRKLVECEEELATFLSEAYLLGDKLEVILVQLPPKLSLDLQTAKQFFSDLSSRTRAKVACEPRHLSWFTPDADQLLQSLGVARVAADPAICEAGAIPGGSPDLRYWRLHGSPVVYRSSYADRIEKLTAAISRFDGCRWCIFDNTASSAGAGDALRLMDALASGD